MTILSIKGISTYDKLEKYYLSNTMQSLRIQISLHYYIMTCF